MPGDGRKDMTFPQCSHVLGKGGQMQKENRIAHCHGRARAEGAALNLNSVLVEHGDREEGSRLSSGGDGCSNSALKRRKGCKCVEEGHTWQESTCRCFKIIQQVFEEVRILF